ncbi:DNA-directed DNA polymerase, putative [Plasmodium gallinaceum]|uniref:DNA-directed DNA polymerase, putative n=1 Tax=Plasmodium gallinaceum TaxID=5849 RepID=A0A1J1GTB3_PLAGA|nr:DNA-directed DNA polymerase, putative [Plasmodium gallinaceum]CRG95756.1 DNA-directed DNA polymerase, putative [Plasmodium gallinaceum]
MNTNWMTHIENLIEKKRCCKKNETELMKKKKKLNEVNDDTINNYYENNYGLNKYNINKKILENYRRENINELYKWQEECLNNLKKVRWKEGENFIYVAPTSGGKTLVAEIFVFEELQKTECIFFLLPLNSLINEKIDYFKKICKDANIKIGSEIDENNIIICTYEKMNNYINKKKINNNHNYIVIIDEFHLINEKPRGIYIENIISKFLFINKKLANIKIICMSGTLNNIPILKRWINAKVYISSYRPQEIKEYYICNYNIFKKEKENFSYYCNIYDFSNLHNDHNSKSNCIDKLNKSKISSFLINKNKILNNSLIHSLLCFSIHSLINNLNTLIFCSTKKNCEFYINVLNQFLNFNPYQVTEDIHIKRSKLNDTISHIDKYAYNKMNKLISNGICYYHSDINTYIKKLLETSFKEKTLFLLTCTSTLSVGLNLQVDRVIISSPFIADNFLSITQYKQMIGRAARLKKGDSIIIIEKVHEKKLLELFKQDFTNIKSIMNNSLEYLEKYIIELICLYDKTLSFSDIIHLLSFSLYYNEIINSITEEKEKDFLISTLTEEKNGDENYRESFELNIEDFTQEEIFFYKKKKDEIHHVINNLLKHKCIEIKNKKFQITNFCRSLCICNFTLSYGIELLNEIKNYDRIYLYNNFHLCYLCSSYNLSITSFNYNLPFLKNLISMISDNYTRNIIFQILKFDSDIINMLNIKNQNIYNKKRLFFNDNVLQGKYCKLYISILLFMYLEKNNFSYICETFKITEDVLQSILQHTYMYIHLLIAFFDKIDEWIIASLLKKFLHYFKNCKSLSTYHYDISQVNNLKYNNYFQKKIK